MTSALSPGTGPNAEPFRLGVLETLTGLDIAADGLPKLSDKQRQAAIEIIPEATRHCPRQP